MGTLIRSWSVTRGRDKPGPPHGDWHQTRGSVWGQVASELLAVTPAHVVSRDASERLLWIHVSRREPWVCGPRFPRPHAAAEDRAVCGRPEGAHSGFQALPRGERPSEVFKSQKPTGQYPPTGGSRQGWPAAAPPYKGEGHAPPPPRTLGDWAARSSPPRLVHPKAPLGFRARTTSEVPAQGSFEPSPVPSLPR